MATYGKPISQNVANPFSGKTDVKIDLVGQGWITLDKFIKYTTDGNGRALKRDLAKAGREFMRRYQRLLVKGLMSEGAAVGQAWPAHSDNYRSPTGWLMHHSSNYQQALENMKVVSKGYTLSLQFKKGDLLRRSVKDGLTVGQNIPVHEYGSVARSIPARALWGPAYYKMGGAKGYTDRVKGAVGARLKKMGITGIRVNTAAGGAMGII